MWSILMGVAPGLMRGVPVALRGLNNARASYLFASLACLVLEEVSLSTLESLLHICSCCSIEWLRRENTDQRIHPAVATRTFSGVFFAVVPIHPPIAEMRQRKKGRKRFLRPIEPLAEFQIVAVFTAHQFFGRYGLHGQISSK